MSETPAMRLGRPKKPLRYEEALWPEKRRLPKRARRGRRACCGRGAADGSAKGIWLRALQSKRVPPLRLWSHHWAGVASVGLSRTLTLRLWRRDRGGL